MRVFERALSRAQLPVSFSEGFNPRVRLSLPVPRAVGVASQVEILVVQLGERMEPAVILDRLARQMPGGLALLEAWHLDDKEVLHAERVEYALDLIPPQVGPVTDAVNRLLAAETWPIERAEPGQRPKRLIDIRAFLVDAVVDAATLRWTASVTGDGTIRPVELLAAVGLDPQEGRHRVRRIAIHWVGRPAAESGASASA